MALKIPYFIEVNPKSLKELVEGMHELVSEDALQKIIDALSIKMQSGEKLLASDVRFLIDWSPKIRPDQIEQMRIGISAELSKSSESFQIAREHFDELKTPLVLKFLLTLPTIENALDEHQKESFSQFSTGEFVGAKKINADQLFNYIDGLFLIENNEYTRGQISQTIPHLDSTDFTDQFESRFDFLVDFFSKCDLSIGSIANLLDKQLGSILDSRSDVVTAKAFDRSLGYFKYEDFLKNNSEKINVRSLANFGRYKLLISRFEEAVNILSEEESVRGLFWKRNLDRVDGVKFKKVGRGAYKIAVAFFVGKYVFCDFGPSGNAIHVYYKDDFIKDIEWQHDWKVASLARQRTSHVGNWQPEVLNQINRARSSL